MDLDNDRLLPPRVLGEFGSVPLVDVLKDLMDRKRYQSIALDGHGSTTALRYVRRLAEEEGLPIAVTDGWLSSQPSESVLLHVTANRSEGSDRTYLLSGWGRDEFIDYLLTYHPTECKRVMALLGQVDMHYADGSPFVWQPYLEWLATHNDLIHPDQFIFTKIESELDDRFTVADIADRLLAPNQNGAVAQCYSAKLDRWLRLDDVQQVLMAKRLADHFRSRNRSMLKHRWPSRMLKAVARDLATDAFSESDLPRTLDFLERSVDKSRYSSTAVSLLNLLVPGWKPQLRRSIDLSWCDFRSVQWAGGGLRCANLRGTQLSSADLSGADLSEASIHKTQFSRAVMSDVQMRRVTACEVSFTDANLTRADFSHSQITESDFTRADLKESHFEYCRFDRVKMRGVDWSGAISNNCSFYCVSFADAQLAGALFQNSYFNRVKWKGASLLRANFGEATFVAGCDLESLDLSGCNFAGARLSGTYLTDSTASGASFKLADLSQAGLAGAVWENCDLRGADLRGAAFHMGSTRCGLVDSPYPSHGTRTGFYTDDYVDLSYKHPEQVRKAALIGCDLRGALLAGCDFYLVDVRDCQLDPDQRELMASCGAILE